VEPSRTGMWVGVGVTAALGIGAGTFAILTQQSKTNFENQLKAFPNSKENIDNARRRMVRNAAITDGLAGATLLAAGITIYLAVSGDSDEPEARRAQVRVLPTPGGLAVSGSF
jgi:hypothetical protein